MLPYGVGADSISARGVCATTKLHGRAMLAPTATYTAKSPLPFGEGDF